MEVAAGPGLPVTFPVSAQTLGIRTVSHLTPVSQLVNSRVKAEPCTF